MRKLNEEMIGLLVSLAADFEQMDSVHCVGIRMPFSQSLQAHRSPFHCTVCWLCAGNCARANLVERSIVYPRVYRWMSHQWIRVNLLFRQLSRMHWIDRLGIRRCFGHLRNSQLFECDDHLAASAECSSRDGYGANDSGCVCCYLEAKT